MIITREILAYENIYENTTHHNTAYFALIIDNYFAGYLLSKGLTYKDTSLVTIMALIGFCLGLLAMYIAQRFK